MKKRLYFPVIFLLLWQAVFCQEFPTFSSQEAYALMKNISPEPFKRTTHPDAQWFPEAGLGLFIHWGIHSVAALDPSWSMINNCPWHKPGNYIGRENYYRLADEFAPSAYDPEKWILAAKQAGFRYVVLTAKHHDGYCLWPYEGGLWGTYHQMGGRDLLRPYVDACRKYGLKVGLYFSPRDWGTPLYISPYPEDDYIKKTRETQLASQSNQKAFDLFFEETIKQLSDLLTRYGKIDLLWFDGHDWLGVETYSEKLHAWLRKIQPGIVINPRWQTNVAGKAFGDFNTEEVSWRQHMDKAPFKDGDWWEFCESWSGHWGYSPLNPFRNTKGLVNLLVHTRSYGGNYLLNIGPAPDGTMRPGFYEQCLELAKWMQTFGESVIGTQAVMNWEKLSGIPMTRNKNVLYLHLLKGEIGLLTINEMGKPVSVELLGSPLKPGFTWDREKKVLNLTIPSDPNQMINRVIKITL